ncbi:MAG: cysteine desulfurase NifS [Thermoplasmata archaeon]|nr:cysteine desulfurase NifS [Thermoplasmata archaeon]
MSGNCRYNVYLDNAATSRLRKEALDAMMPYLTDEYANPSSIHAMSRQPRAAVKAARETIAKCINAEPSEIFFTSGGTESDNWALIGTAEILQSKGKHIIVSTIEHHAILETAKYLESRGFEVTKVPVDEFGVLDLEALKKAIREDTILISVMTANNEIGTIQPIEEIGRIAHEKGILFHTDAVQAFGHIPIDVRRMNVDMLSVSGHKFGGPKGIGFLFIRNKLRIPSFMHGGEQEEGRRAGTTNVPGIVGMGVAAEMACREMKENNERLIGMRDHLIDRVLAEVPYSRLNGHRTMRLPSNADFSFQFIEGESMLMSLGMKGIYISTGSACASGSLDPSHVLLGIGLPHEIAHGSVRMSIPEDTTMEQIDYAVDCLKETVAAMRSLSPLYDDFVKSQKV